jgi:hypothetical protein
VIRPASHRNKPGFAVSGRDQHGRRFRIFARTKEGARLIESAAKRGDSAIVDSLLRAGK